MRGDRSDERESLVPPARRRARAAPLAQAALALVCTAAIVALATRLRGAPVWLASSGLPLPLHSQWAGWIQPFQSEEDHLAFCENNGCPKFDRHRRREFPDEKDDNDRFWQDSSHDELSQWVDQCKQRARDRWVSGCSSAKMERASGFSLIRHS